MSLSIVIPVLNEQDNLAELAKHLAQEATFAEIIVVDGGSRDESQNVAESFADQVIVTELGRAKQMNAGARSATKDYVLFLHADTRLPRCFERVFLNWSECQPSWGFAPVRLDGEHWMFRVIERAISIRSRMTAGASGDQAICVRRDLFNCLGGYQDIPIMEDLALSRRLTIVSRPRCFAMPVTTSSRRWEQRGIIRTVLLMWCLRVLYYLGVAPEKLASRYKS